ncbi:magnesium transporter CorA family protein [Membranicola marinus]|uniref:Magnesium transporter CorA family protein n=1 Tax=Membranihabitans marinus TaxID=1227546 RepID=A0A953HM77_9BACT|nr:magnesium transporter CorA family protein [Membranihabitans marinus]MBY5957083.1 magnesium transporter CorA family protein [Membranihabitans marinus]
MIQYLLKENGKVIEQEHLQPGCWINIKPPFEPNELHDIAEFFEIPGDFLTDALDIDERSRYEKEDNGRLILVNTPILNEKEQENEALYITAPIGIILTENHLITISAQENPVLQLFIDSRVKDWAPEQPNLMVLRIFEQIVLRFLACLKKLNLKRHLVESELYNSSQSSDLKQLLRIEKSLVYFVSSLSSNELLKMKMKRTDFLRLKNDEDLIDLFEDVIIDNSQALDMANIHTNIINGTMEAHASIISNNLNLFVNRLTIITVVLMLPTLIASFYGMNVEGLPFDDSPYGFAIIVILSISVSVILLVIFRRKNLF